MRTPDDIPVASPLTTLVGTQVPEASAQTSGISQRYESESFTIEDVKKIAKVEAGQYVDAFRIDVDKKLESTQKSILEILAVFITLFTFISVNISLFSTLQRLSQAIWFMILMLCCSIVLVSVLLSIISPWRNKIIAIIFAASFGTLIVVLMIHAKEINLPIDLGLISSRVDCIKSCRN